MNGKIDSNGWLHIERGGKMLSQYCPYTDKGEDACRHFCPHFGEPEKKQDSRNGAILRIVLRLCNGTILSFDRLTDEREKT